MEKASVTVQRILRRGGINQKAHAKHIAWAFILRGVIHKISSKTKTTVLILSIFVGLTKRFE